METNNEDLWYSTQDIDADVIDPAFTNDMRNVKDRVKQGQYLDPTIIAERKPTIDNPTLDEKNMRFQFQRDSHRFNPRRAKEIKAMVLSNIENYPKPRKKKQFITYTDNNYSRIYFFLTSHILFGVNTYNSSGYSSSGRNTTV